jgi:signal transduction histidine kinase
VEATVKIETLQVLVVDDEPGMRLGAARVLKGYAVQDPEGEAEVRFQVAVAASAEEALDMFTAAVPDILLLDHKLPGIQGLDLLDRVARDHREVITIMITAYASIETAISATKRGAFDFLAKPFTPDELRSTLQKAARHLLLVRAARRLAEERRQVRFQFISVLAHELKAPLAAVEGYLFLLRDGVVEPGSPKYDEVVGKSLDRVGSMRKLILDLLDLTRLESGQKRREIREVDLRAMAERALETAQPSAQPRDISLELHAPGAMPFMADEGEMEILLNNLVSNAVKYNREGGRVDVFLDFGDGCARIRVADTGIGMTSQDASKLFGEFVRIRNETTRGIPGTGLGLSIVRKLAHLYHGEISVESQVGVGSTFILILRGQDSHAPIPIPDLG